jgi:hypothetical protein
MESLNEQFIKLSSKVPYHDYLSLEQELTVQIEGKHYIFNVVKEEINDLQDGQVNKTFIAKCLLE